MKEPKWWVMGDQGSGVAAEVLREEELGTMGVWAGSCVGLAPPIPPGPVAELRS